MTTLIGTATMSWGQAPTFAMFEAPSADLGAAHVRLDAVAAVEGDDEDCTIHLVGGGHVNVAMGATDVLDEMHRAFQAVYGEGTSRTVNPSTEERNDDQ